MVWLTTRYGLQVPYLAPARREALVLLSEGFCLGLKFNSVVSESSFSLHAQFTLLLLTRCLHTSAAPHAQLPGTLGVSGSGCECACYVVGFSPQADAVVQTAR
jgi:hypothetical protein